MLFHPRKDSDCTLHAQRNLKVSFLLDVFGVRVSCRNLYSVVVYLYVNSS